MPRKKDPWESPSDDSWIAVGKKIIPIPQYKDLRLWSLDRVFEVTDEPHWVSSNLPENPTPYDMPVFVISRIDVTSNGTRMVYFHLLSDSSKGTAVWSKYIRQQFRPAPRPKSVKPKKPKPAPKSRFERDNVI